MLRAPIVYVVGGLFLVVQGIAFAGLVGALSDPREPAPLGALLEGQLAGTLLTWVLQLVVLTLLGMRTIAEDKRSGGWELLLTAQVGEGAAVVGKWLAAATIYALLWLPTLRVPRRRRDVSRRRRRLGHREHRRRATPARSRSARRCSRGRSRRARRRRRRSLPARSGSRSLIGAVPASASCRRCGRTSRSIIRRSRARSRALSLRGQLTTFARGELSLRRRSCSSSGSRVDGPVARDHARVRGPPPRARGAHARRRHRARRGDRGARAACSRVRHPRALGRQRRAAQLARSGDARGARALPAPRDADDRRADARRARADLRRGRARRATGWPRPAPVDGSPRRSGDAAGRARGGGARGRRGAGRLASNGGVVVEVGGRRRVVDRARSSRRSTSAPAVLRTSSSSRSSSAIAGALAELSTPTPVTRVRDDRPRRAAARAAADRTPTGPSVADRLRGEGIDRSRRSTLATGVPARCNVVVVAGPATPLSRRRGARDPGIRRSAAAGCSSPRQVGRSPIAADGSTLAATGLEGVLADERPRPAPRDRGRSDARPCASCRARCSSSTATRTIRSTRASRTRAPTMWFQPRASSPRTARTPLVSAIAGRAGASAIVARRRRRRIPTTSPARSCSPRSARAQRVIALGSAESFSTAVARGRRVGGRSVARARDPLPRRQAGAEGRGRARAHPIRCAS